MTKILQCFPMVSPCNIRFLHSPIFVSNIGESTLSLQLKVSTTYVFADNLNVRSSLQLRAAVYTVDYICIHIPSEKKGMCLPQSLWWLETTLMWYFPIVLFIRSTIPPEWECKAVVLDYQIPNLLHSCSEVRWCYDSCAALI